MTRSPELLRRFANTLGSLDVVHLNGNYNTLNYRIAKICTQAGVPYIVSARSTLDPAALGLLPEGLQRRLAPLEEQYVSAAFAVHFTSDFELERAVLDRDGAQRVVIIPNAVELEHLARTPGRADARKRLGIPEERFALLFFGRLVAQKQPEFALRVLADMDPAIGAHLYFVGSGAAREVGALRAEAARLGVGALVHFAGHASGPDRADWTAAADLLLLTSAAENFSLALVEAVAAGLPAMASPHVGALEFLQDHDCTVVPLDPAAWAAACAEIAARPPIRDDAAFVRLWNRFRPDLVIKEWLRLYQGLPAAPVAARAGGQITAWAKSVWDSGAQPDEISVLPLAGGASSREFFRLSARGESAIAFTCPTRQGDYVAASYDSTQPADWVRVGRLLFGAGMPVPRILRYDQPRDWLLVEDFGDVTLEQELARSGPQRRMELHSLAFELITRLQAATAVIGPDELPVTRALDAKTLAWEFFHYVEWGLEARRQVVVGDEDRVLLLREFGRLADELARSEMFLTHRDYHAQNLMMRPDGSLGMLDFDDLLLGNAAYDLCGFLLDAHSPADYEFADEMVRLFHDVRRRTALDTMPLRQFQRLFDIQAFQRSLKVAGRFVWLAEMAGKSEYLASVDNSLAHARFYANRQPDLNRLRDCLIRYEPTLA